MTDLVRNERVRHSRSHKPVRFVFPDGGTGIEITVDDASVSAFQEAASAPNTRLGYRTDWKGFEMWCAARQYATLPAEPVTVARYLAHSANLVDERGDWFYAPNTISRWLAAINKAHELAGFAKPGHDPHVTQTVDGIRRERARPEARKAPLLLADLRRTLAEIDLNSWPHGVIGHRDSALLLMGFTGAYRRSELAALEIGDVRLHTEDGLHVLLRKSKTDQEGSGLVKGLPYGSNSLTCSPCAFVRWVRVLAAGNRPALMSVLRDAATAKHICRGPVPELEGLVRLDPHAPVFRPVMKNGAIKERAITGAVVNGVLQRRVSAVGMNSSAYGAHSLRAGFVTEAFRAGATHHEVMRQTGHTDISTLEVYSRENNPLAHNAVTRLGF